MSLADDVNLYLNWCLNAVYGRLADADAILRMAPDSIERVAMELRMRHPLPYRPLYRGVLLDPAVMLRKDPNYTFVSWSEDLDVARWFASRDAFISEPITSRYPEAQGFVLTLPEAHDATVLFHYSWRRAFGPPLERLALMHPFMGEEGHNQILWSLSTQREVITQPLATLPAPQPVETLDGASVAEMNERLTPAWIGLSL